MKVSCFSFIREGVRLGYPFEESIRSALPLCDEFVIAVGESDDGTLERLQAMNEPKLRLIPTRWNEACRTHGFVYGHQKVIAQYNCVGDWAFYLEGDEVLHEDDLDRLRGAMAHYLDDTEVEALVFDYFHFYGDAEHLHLPPATYRRAARVIRNSLRSFAPDGLYWAVIKDRTWYGGRNKRRTRYPRAAALNIPLYHYGNARHARYLLVMELIEPWLQSHANPAFGFDPEYRPSRRERKHRRLRVLERKFGWDFSKRHFKVVREYGKGARAAAVRAVT